MGLKRWIAAIVKDGAEQALAQALSADHGLVSYCPMHRRWRSLPEHIARKTGKTRELVQDALLLGYIFVCVSGDEDLADMLAVKGVYGYVRTSSGACYAKDSDIEALKVAEASGKHDVRLKPAKALEAMKQAAAAIDLTDAVGRKVSIVKGPLTGLTAEVNRVIGQDVEVSTPMANVLISAGSFKLA